MKKLLNSILGKFANNSGARKSKTLYIPGSMKEFWENYDPKRRPGETMDQYRKRRKIDVGILKFLKKRSLKQKKTYLKDAKIKLEWKPVLTGRPQSKYFTQSFSTRP